MATILVVEDDINIRSAYMYSLGRAGHKVVEASDGAQALSLLEKSKPDLIILDMLMPGMSGVEFLRASKMKTSHPDTVVIAISNIENPRILEKAKALGAREYLVKVDFTPHQITDLVAKYISSKSEAPPSKS